MSDESDERIEAISEMTYTEAQLSDEEFDVIINDVRLQVIECLDDQEFYHGMFKEDAFTEDWDYDEAMEEYEDELEDED